MLGRTARPFALIANVREQSPREIWFDSEGFNRYRGSGWMKEPCISCDRRELDFGGCRCQAWLLARDPAAAGPVCGKSPLHHRVNEAVARADAAVAEPAAQPLVFRDPAHSRRLGRV